MGSTGTVRVVTPPDAVVTVADAKKHLRVDHTDDDAHIEGLVAAATGWLDGPTGWLGRALGVQVLEYSADSFGDCGQSVRLPYPPHIEVISVKYIDAAGVEITMSPSGYELKDDELRTPNGQWWPAVRCESGAVRVRYRAGYGAPNATDPSKYDNALHRSLWVAILMIVGQWYENRQPVVIGSTVEHLPFAAEQLLSTFRVYS